MKKSYLVLAILLLINFISNAQDTLTILHLNDTHSTLSALGPRNPDLSGTQGGISRAASVIGLTKMTEPNVLTLHAGDVFIGDIFFNVYFGATEFQLLNSLGLDAMTVGNHEFDLEPSTLYASLQSSFLPEEGFPLLSANTILDDTSVQALKDYIHPFIIKQVGNIKVGIFGLTTPEANVTSLPSPAVISEDIINITAAMIDSLTANNCDVIIMLSHLGFALDQTIAENIPGINAIISGHDHYMLENPVEITNPGGTKTYIIQANSNYLCVGKLKLIVAGETVDFLKYQMIHLDQSIPEEPNILQEVNNLIGGIELMYGPVFTQQIGYAAERFKEVADSLMFPGNHDTPVGNLVTDAFRLRTGTDIAIEAGGSTAQPIYEGPIAAADAFRTVGYGFNTVNGLGFRIITFDILGSDLWAALEMCLATIESNDEFFPQVSGMKYIYNPDNEPGSRITAIYINDNFIDPSAAYTVTGNELLVSLLTGLFEIPISNFFCYDSLSEFQVLSEYISLQQTISPLVEGRIVADTTTSVGVDEDMNIPGEFELEQNYPNPFNPSTTFEFQIPKSEKVLLKIYDMLGKEVATVVNEELSVGNYKYQWNVSGLASGVYIYKLQAGNFVSTKKLILMK